MAVALQLLREAPFATARAHLIVDGSLAVARCAIGGGRWGGGPLGPYLMYMEGAHPLHM